MISKLNDNEMFWGGMVGFKRQWDSVCNDRKVRFAEKHPGELWAFHIIAAMAEMAVCKALGMYWDGSVGTFHVSDIPDQPIEVRWSTSGYLKVRKDDHHVILVKVEGLPPTFQLIGWMRSKDAKAAKYLSDPNNRGVPAYFVPTNELRPMSQLREVLDGA